MTHLAPPPLDTQVAAQRLQGRATRWAVVSADRSAVASTSGSRAPRASLVELQDAILRARFCLAGKAAIASCHQFSLLVEGLEAVEQAMLHGEECGRGAGGGSCFGVDPLDVGSRRLGAYA
jgi:hypothetical protein